MKLEKKNSINHVYFWNLPLTKESHGEKRVDKLFEQHTLPPPPPPINDFGPNDVMIKEMHQDVIK